MRMLRLRLRRGNGGEENIEVRIYPFDNERTQTEVIVSLNAIPKYAKCVKYIDMVYDEDGFKYSTKISDPLLLFAIMMQESSCDQEAESSADCVGLMQIQEKTFKDVCTRAGFGYIDSFEKVKGDGNEQNNIECGLRILGVKDNWFGYSSCDANHPCTEHLFLEKFASGYTNAKCVDGTCVYRYKCGDKDVYYSKQEAALRAYNGWACSGANPHYVEEVMEKWEELDAVKPSGAILDY